MQPLLNVFMYHRVLPKASGNVVSAENFRRQIEYLRARYRMLDIQSLLGFLRGEPIAGGPCAAITFDDGWRDNWTVATPILEEMKTPAILALSTAFLDDPSGLYLSRDELRSMAEGGLWSIQAHGHEHARMTDPAMMAGSLQTCSRIIREVAGTAPELFFWPWGIYSEPAVRAAREAGFRYTFTTQKGFIRPGTDEYLLPRIGASDRWSKFRRNVMVFRHPVLATVHSWISPSPSGLRKNEGAPA